MKRSIILFVVVFAGFAFAQHMLVRVYAPTWKDLTKISPKYDLDIASARAGEWYDIVADRNTMDKIIASGLSYEVRIYNIELEKEKVRAQYHSYDEVTQILRNMASTYPSICKFDSLPIRTYQGRWLYGVKISDQPGTEDPTEPGFLIDGLHHSREWGCIELVLFFADSMLRSYGVVSEITNIINNTEIYCFPIINADGYAYDYPGQNMWRKNREPFGGSIGTDCNRNYGGCGPDLDGGWGAVDEGEATHSGGGETFCGAYCNSGDETRGLAMYVRSHIINAYMSYHMSGELLMWGWGWSSSQTYPDNTVHVRWGNRMAGMINAIYGGTYSPGQIPVILYTVSGGSIDWVYSWCHWVGGIANVSFTTEVGTTFYETLPNVDNLVRENFKALKYLAILCRDSVPLLCEGCVAPPVLGTIGTVPPNFTVSWQAINPTENHPTQWELVELSSPSIKTDSIESGTGRWLLQGYTSSTAQAHSATHSLFSGNSPAINNAAQTLHPYIVQPGDSFTFWCYYNLESNSDVTVAEVSENTKDWFSLDTTRFSGTQTSWVRKAYSLAGWVGKSVYFRFRTMYDSNTENGGFYVDDIRPACLFASVNTIATNIPDTFYTFSSHPIGDFYYYVRGYNTTWNWGEYSCLKMATVQAADMPAIPTIIRPFDYAKLPVLQPTLSFLSTDPNGDGIQYRVLWDTDPTFASPESTTTSVYPSGNTVNFVFPSNLTNGTTYWWKVKCVDPSGSGYWTSYTIKRSFTVDTGLPTSTCSWFQTTDAQFNFDTFNGTLVQGDSVLLVPSGQTVIDTILFENFDAGGMPAGWTVVDGNSDTYMWTVGTTSDLGSYTPPDYGTSYAYYSDDDAGSGSVSNNEELLSPRVYTGGVTGTLEIIYGYGLQVYQTGEKMRVKFRKKTGGTWTAWANIAEYTTDISGTETINLTAQLPADSMQFEWFYSDSTASSHYGWACACDNVLLRFSYQLSNDQGALTGTGVVYHDLAVTYPRQRWGDAIWRKAVSNDSIGLQVEYFNGATWQLVPNSLIPGNSTGKFSHLVVDTVKLTNVDTVTYNTLRLKALFYRITKAPGDPALLDWEVGNLSSYIGVEETEGMTGLGAEFGLRVFPTVFQNQMQIRCTMQDAGSRIKEHTLKVYDISGRVVRDLSSNLVSGIVDHVSVVSWNGNDDTGRRVPAGVYFVKLETENQQAVQKAVLLR